MSESSYTRTMADVAGERRAAVLSTPEQPVPVLEAPRPVHPEELQKLREEARELAGKHAELRAELREVEARYVDVMAEFNRRGEDTMAFLRTMEQELKEGNPGPYEPGNPSQDRRG